MLEFVTTEGLTVWLAVDCMVAFYQATGKSTTIIMSSGDRFDVKETCAAILEMVA